MDKIYIVMNYVEHDLKSLMETMKQPFLPGRRGPPAPCVRLSGSCPRGGSRRAAQAAGGGGRGRGEAQKERWPIALSPHGACVCVRMYLCTCGPAGRTGLGALLIPSGCGASPSGQPSVTQQPPQLSPVAHRGGEDADDPAAAGREASARQLDPAPRPQDVQPAAQPRRHSQGGSAVPGAPLPATGCVPPPCPCLCR